MGTLAVALVSPLRDESLPDGPLETVGTLAVALVISLRDESLDFRKAFVGTRSALYHLIACNLWLWYY